MPPVGTATSAPARSGSPSRSSFPPRGGSPLKPHNHPRALKPTPISAANSTTIATKTHLSNLDRVLVKQPSSQPPQLTHDVGRDHDPNKPDHLGGATAAGGGGGIGLLHALNLPSLFPFLRKPAADEMSPRSLTHLQRLLSNSPRPSPKSSIASRWRLYHGAEDWSGLLDPLDENLRRELLRYGDFVQAAYHAFHSRPEASSPARHRHLILPDRSYRPTKSLFATSSLSIHPWVNSSAPARMTQSSSWIGYVAVCDSDREIRRMGRRDIVIVLRGTATCLEWAENLRASLVPMDSPDASSSEVGQHVPKVARGFWSLYKTAGEQVSSLSASVVEEVRRLMEVYKGEELSITVTGHSLGAALAFLVADELSTCAPSVPPIAVVSFGGPRVGNQAFADRIEKHHGVKALRIVNAHDVITKVPGLPLPHLREKYEHVGSELRINSRDSPYLRPDAGPACTHDLEAYLHLVDGFTGTGSPFRSSAKRSLVRLLDQQRRNVKDVYVNRARELVVDPTAAVVRSNPHGCLASPTT
ncbi:phospholipase A1-Ibeta2, chloroplastic [Phoenix dactylifera]|uniref:Phospholipase A1-Ibeta2, chloroplastic n=1 Tax=Phoenix dactylifera TaxID=42345 RepID=A0A8B7CGZ4_PHODC|nr:phospholipase A1-Ibeta2, chloroplastic [Phoenix dactylifera]